MLHVSNFTCLTAREITYNKFEISLVVFMPNITTNHAITILLLLLLLLLLLYKALLFYLITCYVFLICRSGQEPLEGAVNPLYDG